MHRVHSQHTSTQRGEAVQGGAGHIQVCQGVGGVAPERARAGEGISQVVASRPLEWARVTAAAARRGWRHRGGRGVAVAHTELAGGGGEGGATCAQLPPQSAAVGGGTHESAQSG